MIPTHVTIYENGVGNKWSEAKQTRDRIAEATGSITELAYNRCGLLWDVMWKADSRTTDEAVEHLKKLLIGHFGRQTYVFLILHSKGAHIGLLALHKIEFEQGNADLKKYLVVSAYGGIVLIPKRLACGAWNTSNEEDPFDSAGGNWVNTFSGESAITKNAITWSHMWQKGASTDKKNGMDLEKFSDCYCCHLCVSDAKGPDAHSFDKGYMKEATLDYKQFIEHIKSMPTPFRPASYLLDACKWIAPAAVCLTFSYFVWSYAPMG